MDTVFSVYSILQWKDQNYIAKETAFYNTGSRRRPGTNTLQPRLQNTQCTTDSNLTHFCFLKNPNNGKKNTKIDTCDTATDNVRKP